MMLIFLYSIVKTRVRHGVPSYEVTWHKEGRLQLPTCNLQAILLDNTIRVIFE